MKDPIHLRAEGLVFDQKTGMAESDGRVEFQLPQASGTARGATYDSKNNELTLHSAVDITTAGKQPTHIVAHSGTLTKEPRVVTMEGAQMTGQSRTVLADHAMVYLTADNAVQRVNATGNVRVSDTGGMQLRAPQGEMTMGAKNRVESALFTGGVDFASAQQAAEGHSGAMRLLFVEREAKHARAAGRRCGCRPSTPARERFCGRLRGRAARIRRR